MPSRCLGIITYSSAFTLSVLVWKIMLCITEKWGLCKETFSSAWQRSGKASWRKVLSELNLDREVRVRPITDGIGRSW